MLLPWNTVGEYRLGFMPVQSQGQSLHPCTLASLYSGGYLINTVVLISLKLTMDTSSFKVGQIC